MIYYKLDWYSVMLYNQSISFVLKKLGIYEDYLSDIIGTGFERSTGLGSRFVFSLDGVTIETENFWYQQAANEAEGDMIKIFDHIFDHIRLDISGSGLEWLRSLKYACNPEKDFQNIKFWSDSPLLFKVTRCDFAFDFVNVNDFFTYDFIKWIQDYEAKGNVKQNKIRRSRLKTGTPSGCIYKSALGSTIECVWLGSSQADAMLRIYNKLLEQQRDGLTVKPMPDAFIQNEPAGIVNSWFRIELQARRDKAALLLFQPEEVINGLKDPDRTTCPWSGEAGDYTYVLRYIFDNYLIRDENKQPLQMFLDLFDFAKLPKLVAITGIMCNKVKSVLQKSKDYIMGPVLNSLLVYISHVGKKQFIKDIEQAFMDFQKGDSRYHRLKHKAFLNKLGTSMIQEGVSINDLKVKEIANGLLALSE